MRRRSNHHGYNEKWEMHDVLSFHDFDRRKEEEEGRKSISVLNSEASKYRAARRALWGPNLILRRRRHQEMEDVDEAPSSN